MSPKNIEELQYGFSLGINTFVSLLLGVLGSRGMRGVQKIVSGKGRHIGRSRYQLISD